MRVSSPISSGLCLQAYSTRALNKFLDTNLEVIKTCIISNCGEFAIIKIGVVDLLFGSVLVQFVA